MVDDVKAVEEMSLSDLYDLAEHLPLVHAALERAYYIGHSDGQKSGRPRDDQG